MPSAPRPDAGWVVTRGLVVVALLLYPAIVYLAARSVTPLLLGVLLALVLVARALLATPGSDWHRWRWAPAAGAGAILVAVALRDDLLPLRFYPVAANAAVCLMFTASLFTERSLVERIARATEGELPPAGVRYTRRVTEVWAVFLAANTLVSAYTATSASLEAWALWNGLLAYVAMALLFGLEYLVRLRARRAWTTR